MIRIEGIPIVAARLAAATKPTKLIKTSRRVRRRRLAKKTVGYIPIQTTNAPVAA
ncbi:MAG TPA: hypothetical protein VGF08_14260 [Terriglobales bacterium]|jgi:hypothetical protein